MTTETLALVTQTLPAGFGDIDGISPVYGISGTTDFSGDNDDYLELGHGSSLELANGTISMTFNAHDVSGSNSLFSKDANGYDNGGHIMTYIYNGKLYVRFQSEDSTKYIDVPDFTVATNTDYHLAVSFGEKGLAIYVDGVLMAAEPTIDYNLSGNGESLVVGASGAYRTNSGSGYADSEFDGTITDFAIYDQQISSDNVAYLSGNVAAIYEMNVEDLMPALAQLHHASDQLKLIAANFGYNHMGTTYVKDIENGSDNNDSFTGSEDADYYNGKLGDDTLSGGDGNDELQGGYGNDDLYGGNDNDILDGGHGEDILNGGAGDDLLISQADGREGYVSFDPFRDEGDPYNELDAATGKLYADQAIPADDILTGGSGADTFYFQTLINTKQRYIEKHTNDDGTINWHGVAGENDKIHDHWVDVIGNDTITDFNRIEGDKIVIEGHTTEIWKITYDDANDDGIIDSTVIHLYSDQGNNGGAHNHDLLGTITVFGDLVTEDDIIHTSGPAYGIVKSVDDIDEAITPITNGTDRGVSPTIDYSDVTDFGVINGLAPVFAVNGKQAFSGNADDYAEIGHHDSLQLEAGTYSLRFNATNVMGKHALFSKDAKEYGEGGHITAYIQDGIIKVRLQTTDGEQYLKLTNSSVAANTNHHLAISFGEEGFKVYLNGALSAAIYDFTQDMSDNIQSLVLGASGQNRGNLGDNVSYRFQGTITDFSVYDKQLTLDEVNQLIPNANVIDGLDTNNTLYGAIEADIINGADFDDYIDGNTGDDTIVAGAGNDTVYGLGDNDNIDGGDGNDILYGGADHDVISGGDHDDYLDGGDGNDVLSGDAGNDLLYGFSGDDSLYGGSGLDSLQGGEGNDFISGGDHDDYLDGAAGDDTLEGGSGDDLLFGFDGNDKLYGGLGDDTLLGHDGNDSLNGDNGNDYMEGGAGKDTLNGGKGDDFLYGFAGNDLINGGDGIDLILGQDGNDTLNGGDSNDSLYGGNDNDKLNGNGYDDYLNGDLGNDTIAGGTGNDTIVGNIGADRLTGDDGDDNFIFYSHSDSDGLGRDYITDFTQGDDLIHVSGLGFNNIQLGNASGSILGFTHTTSNTIITSSGTFQLELEGVVNLDMTDFVF